MNNSTDHFYHQLFLGNIAKEAVKIILEKADYRVEPYGYETTLTFLKHELKRGNVTDAETVNKIRNTPDLLVFDKDKKEIKLLEIKIRDKEDPNAVGLGFNRIKKYKKYWRGATLVLAVPCGNYFYVKDICELTDEYLKERRKNKFVDFNLSTDFKRFEDVFTKVDPADVKFYGEKLKRILRVYYKKENR